jgi:hypothetical protein
MDATEEKRMRIRSVFHLVTVLIACLLPGPFGISLAQTEATPLEFLKAAEFKHSHEKGEIYLGRVMTLTYPAYTVQPEGRVHPLLLELTDVLKTPLRENYRLVLEGYSDTSGSPEENLELSRKRAETLKKILVQRYYMKESRITAEGHGEANPAASNETPAGRALNRRVEIHAFGDVSEAVRFRDRESEKKR